MALSHVYSHVHAITNNQFTYMKNEFIRLIGYGTMAAAFAFPAMTLAATTYSNVSVGVGVNGVNVGSNTQASTSSSADQKGIINADTRVDVNGSTKADAKLDAKMQSSSSDDDVMVSNSANVSTDADARAYANEIMKNDNKIVDATVNDDTVTLSYRAPAKFLGFLPITMTVTAEADQSGNVTVSYPWYSFLVKSNGAALHASAEAKAHAAAQSAIFRETATTTTASSTASTTVSVSMNARIKALLIDALHAAFKAQVQSETNANANY